MTDNQYFGIYQGVVCNIKDTEKRGRIRVKCPDVLGADTQSAWCDPVVPVAYDNGGDFYIPELGEAVWVMFIGGDVNFPVWLGGWWQKKMSPLGSSYKNVDKVRIISFANCSITMKEGEINFNVGEGEWDFQIKDGKVKMKESESKQMEDISKKLTSLEDKITSLKSKVDGFDTKIDSAVSDVSDLKSKVSSLEGIQAQLSQTISDINTSISQLEQRVVQLESK